MRKYLVEYLDKGSKRSDEFMAYSTNEAAKLCKERYGNHVQVGAVREVK
jgi:hypothetical protein